MPETSSTCVQDRGQPDSNTITDHPNDDVVLSSIANIFEDHYGFELPHCRFTKAEDEALLHLLKELRADWTKRGASLSRPRSLASSAPLREPKKSERIECSTQSTVFQIEDPATVFGGPQYVDQAFYWPEDTESFRDTFGYGGPENDGEISEYIEQYMPPLQSASPTPTPMTVSDTAKQEVLSPTHLRSSSPPPSSTLTGSKHSAASSTRSKNRAVHSTESPSLSTSTPRSASSDSTGVDASGSVATNETFVFTQTVGSQQTVATVPHADEGSTSTSYGLEYSYQSSPAHVPDKLQADLLSSPLSSPPDSDMEQSPPKKCKKRSREDEKTSQGKPDELAADTTSVPSSPKRRKVRR